MQADHPFGDRLPADIELGAADFKTSDLGLVSMELSFRDYRESFAGADFRSGFFRQRKQTLQPSVPTASILVISCNGTQIIQWRATVTQQSDRSALDTRR